MKAGGFRLTNFISNNKNVMKTIPETVKTKSLQGTCFNSDIKERTLGITWDIVKDSFIFESLTFEREEVTKRAILKIVASIFDPLGFISPFFFFNSKNFPARVMEIRIRFEYNYRQQCKKGVEKVASRTKKRKQS